MEHGDPLHKLAKADDVVLGRVKSLEHAVHEQGFAAVLLEQG